MSASYYAASLYAYVYIYSYFEISPGDPISVPVPPFLAVIIMKNELWAQIKSATLVSQLWIGDGVMVWNNDKRVCVPISVGFLASIASGIIIVYTEAMSALVLEGKIGWNPYQLQSWYANLAILSAFCLSGSHVTHASDDLLQSVLYMPTSKQLISHAAITFSIIGIRMGLGTSVEKYLQDNKTMGTLGPAKARGETANSAMVFAQRPVTVSDGLETVSEPSDV
ncbi:hypothetical protein CONPUDRAFT_75708 [Coniophora puteana RWD-64-598 SS2]|uniref:Uncharacterized protein n=1 Tax=Coniophora puteana (strain RWD-64-598) TaxID=741705 RepID=A0A5M3MFD6_CONPW|nr:uncharacterized protein CONPUDRAFT_75708 [Coniophora puteana RWD-64-598 SS2]EIW77958.1 hypothetical protein CONPUDRAFT_75708 [Coniophora puteana RWD-64-598 SS2]